MICNTITIYRHDTMKKVVLVLLSLLVGNAMFAQRQDRIHCVGDTIKLDLYTIDSIDFLGDTIMSLADDSSYCIVNSIGEFTLYMQNDQGPVVEAITVKEKLIGEPDVAEQTITIKDGLRLIDWILLGLIVLLMTSVVWLFLKLKEYNDSFRDNLIKQLKNSESGGRLDKIREGVIEEAVSISDSHIIALKKEVLQICKENEEALYALQQKLTKKDGGEKVTSQTRPMNVPVSLYADSIVNGRFNKVRQQPDDDTIFELELKSGNDGRALVRIYEGAYRRILANPSFLDGCDRQMIGNSSVEIQREGVAERDENDKWIMSVKPSVIIK